MCDSHSKGWRRTIRATSKAKNSLRTCSDWDFFLSQPTRDNFNKICDTQQEFSLIKGQR